MALGSAKTAAVTAAAEGGPENGCSSRAASASPLCTDLEANLRSKKTELKLYCDLLMQQTHSLKTNCQDEALSRTPEGMDRLTEGASLLAKTCDTFICSLDDVMRLAASAGVDGEPRSRKVSTAVENITSPQPTSPVSNGFRSVFGGDSHEGTVSPP